VPKAIRCVCFILASSRASLRDQPARRSEGRRTLGETGSVWPAGPPRIAHCNAKATGEPLVQRRRAYGLGPGPVIAAAVATSDEGCETNGEDAGSEECFEEE
jgi:hypothetical protein